MTKVTVIGMGQMGSFYTKNLVAMGHEVIGCDIDPNKVELAKGQFPDLQIEGSLDVLPVTDVAVIASSTPSHASVIEVLSARGTRFFFCEKPLGLSVEETDRIATAVQSVDGRVYTAFLINFSPVVAEVLKLMTDEDLVMAEGFVTWGKNRFGDTRPSAGDTEDESVHGAELLRMLAAVNRHIHQEKVSGQISYLDFVDQAAQDHAHALDPSFPTRVDSTTMATLAMETDTGSVICSLQSSFLIGEQVRQVRILLADRVNPKKPRYAIRMDFDVRQDDNSVKDVIRVTDIQNRKDLGEQAIGANKLYSQLDAFFRVVNGQEEDARLTSFWRARAAVRFTKAIQDSHWSGGTPVSVMSRDDIHRAA